MSPLKTLLDQATEAMQRDIERIHNFSRSKKLTPGYARDVREYVKVLALLAKMEKDAALDAKNDVSKLSDDELRKLAKEALNE